jgi:AcrR family transcriptional regulator
MPVHTLLAPRVTLLDKEVRRPPRCQLGYGGAGADRAERMQRGRKSTQRQRLIAGVVDAANRGGYASASVTAVITNAGVSRPTFYDYFSDRDDSFRAAIEDVQAELLTRVEAALVDLEPEESASALTQAMVAYASEQPERARFLMAESIAGGSEALRVRDRGVIAIAKALEQAQRRAAPDAPLPDLPGEILVGGIYRVLATRLRRGEARISRIGEELLGWLAGYRRPAEQRRWQKLVPGPTPARSPYLPALPIHQTPSVFPPGRPRLSEQEVAENRRLRLLYATARLAEEKGYIETTVSDITRLARVDGRAFYRLFSDKQDAFSAVHELGFQQVMDVTAKAFFAVDGWPQRSWEAARALTQLLQENPLVAHIGFVEAYAVGPAAVQRVEDSHIAFMFFLQEGLVQRPQTEPISRVAMEAIIAGVFEVIYLKSRARVKPQLARMLSHVMHLWLAPFLGVAESDAFIDRQLQSDELSKAQRKRTPAKRRRRE